MRIALVVMEVSGLQIFAALTTESIPVPRTNGVRETDGDMSIKVCMFDFFCPLRVAALRLLLLTNEKCMDDNT